MNECIDSTMGHIPHMLPVLLSSDDPRTSWSFHTPNSRTPRRQRHTRDLTYKGRSEVGINVGFQYLNCESVLEGLPMKPVGRKSVVGV
jgi:hypothetical protein